MKGKKNTGIWSTPRVDERVRFKPSGRQLRREAERHARKEAKKQQSAQKGFLN